MAMGRWKETGRRRGRNTSSAQIVRHLIFAFGIGSSLAGAGSSTYVLHFCVDLTVSVLFYFGCVTFTRIVQRH